MINENKAKTGKRISELREKAGYKTIEKFADELGYSRQTVAKWENGNAMPTLDQLCDIVSLLECDIGYLLCLYDTRYFEHADICKTTGLSEDAVNILTAEAEANPQANSKADIISHMIESPNGIWDLIIRVVISKHLYQSIKNNPFSSAADKAYKQVKKLFVELLAPYDTEKEIFIKYLEKEVGYPVEQAEYLFRMEKHAEELPGLEFALSKAFLEIIEEYAAEGHEIER